ncbi:hypothetical protein ADIS_1051 [Lunatimonas lonarensis]|uniref:Uncharacterized protein n=1 Tax=Lunatimonas lonarensis TaxID=1232681 RepID=R7ZWB8_9BACT|nr:hypothetical protein [Lunatimonas lonarensis]EON78440.1 hypothetical protein ADIS_1051 [Lunatimonas lonarensis]
MKRTFKLADPWFEWENPFRRVFPALFCFFLFNVFSYAQTGINSLDLRVLPMDVVPTQYHFAKLVDKRTDRSPVAFLVSSSNTRGNLDIVDLRGGTMPALEAFVFGAVPRRPSLRSIQIQVRDCKIVERLVDPSRGVVEGDVYLDFGYFLHRTGDPVHLLDFQGGMSYKRRVGQLAVIEPIFRKSLVNALTYFHDWVEREAGTNEKLADRVSVAIRDYRVDNRDDTVFYDPKRPLTWNDFTGRPRMGNFAASIFASIAYEGDTKLVNGEVQIDLVFKTYMLKSSSWVRPGNNEYGLNHEQRHFDIAQIITERLKARLRNMDLMPHNFDRVVSFEFLESYREMNRLQEQYDRETAHGMNRPAQERWNILIDEELRLFGVID